MEAAYNDWTYQMKASELYSAVQDFESYYLHSDLNMEVHLGCECGCGGDSYTLESWNEMCNAADEARKEFKQFCESLGVEWDYD